MSCRKEKNLKDTWYAMYLSYTFLAEGNVTLILVQCIYCDVAACLCIVIQYNIIEHITSTTDHQGYLPHMMFMSHMMHMFMLHLMIMPHMMFNQFLKRNMFTLASYS